MAKARSLRKRIIWAYAYEVIPPQTKRQLRGVSALLEREHAAVHNGSRTWVGRLIVGPQATRILIVSDSLVRNRVVNKQLEAALQRLKIGFSVSEPVALLGTVASLSP